MHEHIKDAADVAAAGTTIGALMGYLPSVAAVFTIVWTAIRIWESDSVQKLLGRKQGV